MYLRPYSGDKFKAILFYEQLHCEHVYCVQKNTLFKMQCRIQGFFTSNTFCKLLVGETVKFSRIKWTVVESIINNLPLAEKLISALDQIFRAFFDAISVSKSPS